MTVKAVLEATRKLRDGIQSFHEKEGTADSPEVVERLEELRGREQELEHRLEAITSFPFPLVTSIDEYEDLLPDALKLGSEWEWVRWLRSHLRPDGDEWTFDKGILNQIKDSSLCWNAVQVDNEFAKHLERLDAHLGGQQQGRQDTATDSNIPKPLAPSKGAVVKQTKPRRRSPITAFIDAQIQGRVTVWQDAWNTLRSLAAKSDGKELIRLGSEGATLKNTTKPTSLNRIQEAVEHMKDGGYSPKTISREDFRKLFHKIMKKSRS